MARKSEWMYVEKEFLDEDKLRFLAAMNEILEKFGCDIKVETVGSGEDQKQLMILGYDEEAANKVLSRNAGRKVKDQAAGLDVTIGEARKMLETKTKEQVAQELGISRRTLYRRLERPDHEYISDL